MQELYRVLKPGGMAIYRFHKIYQGDYFADDSITDQNSEILANTITSVFMDAIILINYEVSALK
jgi:ubiquinone/menaquinone biosynthesis C-methylase UbiE